MFSFTDLFVISITISLMFSFAAWIWGSMLLVQSSKKATSVSFSSSLSFLQESTMGN